MNTRRPTPAWHTLPALLAVALVFTFTLFPANPAAAQATLQALAANGAASAGGTYSNITLSGAGRAYTALLPSTSTTTHVKLMPTLNTASASATMTVAKRGYAPATIVSTAQSAAIELNAGTTMIDVVVTSQNSATVNTYTVTITKTQNTNQPLWSATLTAQEIMSGGFGCEGEQASCSSQLTDNNFVIGGTSYSISLLKGSGQTLLSGNAHGIQMDLIETPNPQLKALNFCMGSTSYSLSTPLTAGLYILSTTNPNWQAGQKIFLQISTTCPLASPDITGLQVSAGDASLALSWNAPSGTVGGYTAQYKTAAATSWTTVTHSGTTASITGLINGTTYNVRVRARNADGVGAWATGSGTPRLSSVNLSALLVHASEDGGTTFSSTALTYAPTFAAGINAYTASVDNAVTHVRVTPTATAPITVGKQGGTLTAVTSGTASSAIKLDVGANAISVAITLADNSSTNTYTVTITRDSVSLSALTASASADAAGSFEAITLSPAFSANTLAYTAQVESALTHLKVTATVATRGATLRLGSAGNLAAAASGMESEAIALSPGANEIVVEVTSQDGATSKNYRLTVTRLSSSALTRAAHALAPEVARVITGGAMDAVSKRMERLMSGDSPAATDAGNGFTMNLAENLRANAANVADTTTAGWLSGLSFAQSLSGDAGGVGVNLWGSGRHRSLAGEHRGIEWDGSALDVHVGADRRLNEIVAAGAVLSWSSGGFDWDEDGGEARGKYDFDMRSVHPYLGWRVDERLYAWGSIGWGTGTVEPQQRGGARTSNDASLNSIAVGARGELREYADLIEGGHTTLAFKSELWSARLRVGADGAVASHSVDARRLRLALTGDHTRILTTGAILTPSLELGLRNESGDGATGEAIELGGAVHYDDPNTRWTMEGRTRTLWRHDRRDWSISGAAQLAANAGGRGLSLRLAPAWGATAQAAHLWGDDTVAHTSAAAQPDEGASLSTRIGYGMAAFDGAWIGAPHLSLGLHETGHIWRLGWRLTTLPGNDRFNLDLNLEGNIAEPTDNATTHGLMLRGVVRW